MIAQRHPHLNHEEGGLPVYLLTGTNTESAWLGGSICAERSALTQLRQAFSQIWRGGLEDNKRNSKVSDDRKGSVLLIP